jgi:hypothetical protein
MAGRCRQALSMVRQRLLLLKSTDSYPKLAARPIDSNTGVGGSMALIVFLAFLLLICGAIANARKTWRNRRKMAAMTPVERQAHQEERERRKRELSIKFEKLKQDSADRRRKFQWGQLNTAMICPHCQTRGTVRTASETRKAGVSGGKATAALLTGGTSLLLTGLSRNQQVTQAHCDNCNSTWNF